MDAPFPVEGTLLLATTTLGEVGFSTGEGGSIEPPKIGGGGVGKRAQLTGQSIGYYERWPKAPKNFLSIENGQNYFSPHGT